MINIYKIIFKEKRDGVLVVGGGKSGDPFLSTAYPPFMTSGFQRFVVRAKNVLDPDIHGEKPWDYGMVTGLLETTIPVIDRQLFQTFALWGKYFTQARTKLIKKATGGIKSRIFFVRVFIHKLSAGYHEGISRLSGFRCHGGNGQQPGSCLPGAV